MVPSWSLVLLQLLPTDLSSCSQMGFGLKALPHLPSPQMGPSGDVLQAPPPQALMSQGTGNRVAVGVSWPDGCSRNTPGTHRRAH